MVKDTGPHRGKAGIALGRSVYSLHPCTRLEARNIPYLHSCKGISQSLSCSVPRSMPVRSGTVLKGRSGAGNGYLDKPETRMPPVAR
jgi:hypothetical protein